MERRIRLLLLLLGLLSSLRLSLRLRLSLLGASLCLLLGGDEVGALLCGHVARSEAVSAVGLVPKRHKVASAEGSRSERGRVVVLHAGQESLRSGSTERRLLRSVHVMMMNRCGVDVVMMDRRMMMMMCGGLRLRGGRGCTSTGGLDQLPILRENSTFVLLLCH